ncbi:APC family permease [Legionella spiritensis]|uniref:Amino acid antiporter n=1 Tax=Legionella spiritensis TaxID=452 RepID=A0A0W0YYV6_LEGSP|nr:APC family permease [Legionella spiritensis]KTD62027.1 amino acid antiporter [Legionella spiritensis]SNV34658.1 amino acid antiporter [Legionella spiritensis]
MKTQQSLGTLSLMLITVGSVDSIRNLPAAALSGDSILLYFFVALTCFLLPTAVISIWFANRHQDGIYEWVTVGLGARKGFLAVWFQWMQNILIYPTLFSFIAGVSLFTLAPQLAENKYALFLIINALIWFLTWVNIKGIYLSVRLNTFCTIIGLIIPFLMILAMGIYSVLSGYHPEGWQASGGGHGGWSSLTAIILSLCGVEIAGVHSRESTAGAFTKAIILAVPVIFLTMLFGTLTIYRLIASAQLSLVNGIAQVVAIFFSKIHGRQFAGLFNLLIVIGCIGCANNWLIAPVKGLLFSMSHADKGERLLTRSPEKLLLIQAGCVSLLSTLFLLLPAINASYWLMLVLATQMYLLMYSLMFISAIRLQLSGKQPVQPMILFFSALGLLTVIVLMLVSFEPPSLIDSGSRLHYGLLMGLCLLFLSFASYWGREKWLNKRPIL